MFRGTAAFVGTLGKGVTLVELFRDRIMYLGSETRAACRDMGSG